MEKEFVPYELALKLKQLGFDEPCFGIFRDNELVIGCNPDFAPNNTWCSESKFSNESNISAPLFQQAFRWFRDRDFHASVESYHCLGKDRPFGLGIDHKSNGIWGYVEYSGDGNFDTYEEAQLKAVELILEVLEKSVPC